MRPGLQGQDCAPGRVRIVQAHRQPELRRKLSPRQPTRPPVYEALVQHVVHALHLAAPAPTGGTPEGGQAGVAA